MFPSEQQQDFLVQKIASINMEFHDRLPECIRRAAIHMDVFIRSIDLWELWQKGASQGMTAEEFSRNLRAMNESLRQKMDWTRRINP